MEKSNRWLLMIIILIVSGLTLTGGIIVYGGTIDRRIASPDKMQVHPQYLVFHENKSEVEKVELSIDGKPYLHFLRDHDDPLHHWRLQETFSIPYDRIKIDRYVDQLLGIQFSGFIQGHAHSANYYGLDYPTYEVKISTASGKTETLLVGNRMEGSQIAYAVLESSPQQVSTINDLYLLQKTVGDFFTEELFRDDPSTWKNFEYSILFRGLTLGFENRGDGNNWKLSYPWTWTVKEGEFLAFLRDLQYMAPQDYYNREQMNALEVNLSQPLYRFRWTDRLGPAQMDVYQDAQGNFYASSKEVDWFILLPDAFWIFVNKPMGLLLTPIPGLPSFEDVQALHLYLDHREFHIQRKGETWYEGERQLGVEEERKVEVWYNRLNQSPLVSTHASEPETELPIADFRVQIREGMTKSYQWYERPQGMVEVAIDHQLTGFVTTYPNFEPFS